jgi:hypothetical protein
MAAAAATGDTLSGVAGPYQCGHQCQQQSPLLPGAQTSQSACLHLEPKQVIKATTCTAILEGLELGTSVDLVQSLGLDISSSSADESSPIKKQQKTENRKKRKRPHLGFSAPTGPETFHSPAKRKNVSK